MEKILTILSYIIKVFFAVIGVMAIIGFFSDDTSDWSLKYTEDLSSKITLLQTKIDTSKDAEEQAKDTHKLVELLKKQEYLNAWIERLNGYESLSSVLKDGGIEGAIEYLNIDANFEDFVKTDTLIHVKSARWIHKISLDDLSKSQRFYLLHEIYTFKAISDNKVENSVKSKEYLEKSIEAEESDWGYYQYGKLLLDEKNHLAIEYFRKALRISEDEQFREKIQYNLAKSLALFNKKEEAKKIYITLIKSKDYRINSLLDLVELSDGNDAKDYFNQIEEDKIDNLERKREYMEAVKRVALINLKSHSYSEAKVLFEKALEFYHDNSTSNPDMFIDIAMINRKLINVYKGLGFKGSQKESLKRALFYYNALNKTFDGQYVDDIKSLEKLQKEIGE